MKKLIFKYKKNLAIFLLCAIAFYPIYSFAQTVVSNYYVDKAVKIQNESMDALYNVENLYRNAIRTAADRSCDAVTEKEKAKMAITNKEVQSLCKENAAPSEIVKAARGTSDFLLGQ